jgi:hypothetical protein
MFQQTKNKVIDRFLTLYLINDGFERKQLRFLNETKLQKLVFLSELDMINQREKGFNFYFMRLHYGPYSFDLAEEKARLIQMSFLEEKTLKPTKDATYLIKDFSELIDRNCQIMSKISCTNDTYAPLELDFLLGIVHSMPWGKATIHDLPERTPMLYPMKPNAIKEQLIISEKELDDLVMNLDPDICHDLDDATRDVNERRLLTHEQVFSNV